jgi:hypothetical protein
VELALLADSFHLTAASLTDLSVSERFVVDMLALLRFAEPIQVLEALIGSEIETPLADLLKALREKDFIVEIAGRYALRQEFATKLFDAQLSAPYPRELGERLLKIARHFEALADRMESVASLHYALEAERLYFLASEECGADAWADGVRALATAGGALTEIPLWSDAFLLATLADYYQQLGPQLFKGLSERVLARWDVVLSRVDSLPARELKSLLIKSIREDNPAFVTWFVARGELERSGYRNLEAARPLFDIRNGMRIKKRQTPLTNDDLQLLGHVYLNLCWVYQISYFTNREDWRWSAWLRLSQLAARCYRGAGDPDGVDYAQKVISLAYLNRRQYTKALKALALPIRRTVQGPGFARMKAGILINTFSALLGSGHLQEAEGYFHESNYQYSEAGASEQLAPLFSLGAVLVETLRLNGKVPPALPLELVLKKISAIWQTLTPAARHPNLRGVTGLLAEAVRYYVETQNPGNALVTFTQLLTTYDESAGYAEAESSRQGDMTEWLAHVIATVVRSVEQTPDLHRQMMQGVQTVRNKRAAKILTHTLKGESIFSRSLKKLF